MAYFSHRKMNKIKIPIRVHEVLNICWCPVITIKYVNIYSSDSVNVEILCDMEANQNFYSRDKSCSRGVWWILPEDKVLLNINFYSNGYLSMCDMNGASNLIKWLQFVNPMSKWGVL